MNSMTAGEQAAFHAGLAHAASLAQIAAVTIEVRPDAHHVRQRAATEALRGLAEGLRSFAGDTTSSPDRCISAVVYSGLEFAADREVEP